MSTPPSKRNPQSSVHANSFAARRKLKDLYDATGLFVEGPRKPNEGSANNTRGSEEGTQLHRSRSTNRAIQRLRRLTTTQPGGRKARKALSKIRREIPHYATKL